MNYQKQLKIGFSLSLTCNKNLFFRHKNVRNDSWTIFLQKFIESKLLFIITSIKKKNNGPVQIKINNNLLSKIYYKNIVDVILLKKIK